MSLKHLRAISFVMITALIVLGLVQSGGIASAALRQVALSATKTVEILTDNDSDGQADPGDTLRYTITITNSGTNPATNVQINDPIDAQTTFVIGSLRVSPVGAADSYTATGNVQIARNAANGVLANDYLGQPAAATSIAAYDATSANGGTVTLNTADGSFTYNPPPGFEGTDTFTYTLNTNGVGPATLSPVTVTITVSDLIWFVKPDGSPVGDGRLSAPYSGLSAYNVANLDEAGDFIFLYSGTQSTGITLKDNQWLIGQGVTLSDQLTAAGITLASATDATLLPLPAASTNPVISSSAGNGITLAQNNTVRGITVGATSGTGITGTNVGTFTASAVSVLGTGRGVDITSGALNASFDEISSANTTGINLSNVSGTFNVTTGRIAAANAPGVTINSNVTLGVTLEQVSASNTTDGIVLNGTGGSFTVQGTGTTSGSGGTISNTNNGARLTSATNVTLRNMNFTNANTIDGGAAVNLTNVTGLTLDNVVINTTAAYGILGTTVSGFTLQNSTITQCGNAQNEGCLKITELTGDALITGSTLSYAADRTAQITNTSGVLRLGIKNSTFSDSQSSPVGADGLEVQANGTANVTVGIDGSSFLRNRTFGFQFLANNSAVTRVDVFNSTFDAGADIGSGISLAASGGSRIDFNVTNNPTIRSSGGDGVSARSVESASMQGRITGNTIQSVSTISGTGIDVAAEDTSTATITIENNTVNVSGFDSAIATYTNGSTARLDATINDNRTTVAGLSFTDIEVTAAGSTTTCANITNNSASGATGSAFDLQTTAGATVQLQGFNTNALTTWTNNGNTPPSALESNLGTLTGGTCITPTHTATPAIVLFDANRPARTGEAYVYAASDSRATQQTVSAASGTSTAQTFAPVTSGKPLLALRRSGETVSLTNPIPVLPSGASVTIIFDVTIDSPLIGDTTQVCNQSTIAAAGGISLLTDDPGVAGATDPTCIAVDTPDAPTLTKAFGASSIPVGQTTSLTFTVVNNDLSAALTNVAFSDQLPVTTAGELEFISGSESGTCLATPASGSANLSTITATNDTLSVSGITLGANSQCTLAISVRAYVDGTYPNTSSVVSATEITGTTTASDTLTVTVPEPAITKSFAPDTVTVGETTQLTFTVTNTAAIALTNASFSDALPITAAGEIAFVPGTESGTCLQAPFNGSAAFTTTVTGDDTLTITGLALATNGDPGSECTLTVDVNTAAAGIYDNVSSVVTSDQIASTTTASDTLTVTVPEPTISKTFAPDTVNVGETTQLTFTVTNTAAIALTNASFSDALPITAAGEIAFVSGTESGTCLEAPFNGSAAFSTTVASDDTLTITGMALAANSDPNNTCTLTVNVSTAAAGTYDNVSSVVTSDQFTGTTTASDTLTVTVPEPTISKSFAPETVNVGETTQLTFTVTNTAAIALTNASFSDALPITAAGEIAFVSGTETGTCLEAPFNGTVAFNTTVASDDTLIVTGMAFAADGDPGNECTLTVDINTAAAGTYDNVSSVVTSDQITSTTTASATLTVTVPEPTISKSFAPDTVNAGETTQLTFTVINHTALELTNASFSDTLPVSTAGELAFVSGTETGTCLETPFDGTTTFSTTIEGDDTLMVTGMAFAADGDPGSECTLTVDVNTAAAGTYDNVTSVVMSDQMDGTTTASAQLTVNTSDDNQPDPTAAPSNTDQQPQISQFDPALSKLGVLLPGQLGLPGEQLTWIITVANNGDATGSNIVITDTQRDELRIDRVETDRGTYVINGQTVTITIPYLDPGETVQARITVTVLRSPENGELTNTVTLEGAGETRTANAVLTVPVNLPNTGYPPQDHSNQQRDLPWEWALIGIAGLLSVFVSQRRRFSGQKGK